MDKRRKSHTISSCNLVQSDIFTGINNLKKLSVHQKKTKRVKHTVMSPHVIEIDDSDSEINIKIPLKLVRRKLASQFSDDENEDNDENNQKVQDNKVSHESIYRHNMPCSETSNLRIVRRKLVSPFSDDEKEDNDENNQKVQDNKVSHESIYRDNMPCSKTSNLKIIPPIATSTPCVPVGLNDLNCETMSNADSVNSADSQDTVIYGNETSNKSDKIKVIDNCIVRPNISPPYTSLKKRVAEHDRSPKKQIVRTQIVNSKKLFTEKEVNTSSEQGIIKNNKNVEQTQYVLNTPTKTKLSCDASSVSQINCTQALSTTLVNSTSKEVMNSTRENKEYTSMSSSKASSVDSTPRKIVKRTDCKTPEKKIIHDNQLTSAGYSTPKKSTLSLKMSKTPSKSPTKSPKIKKEVRTVNMNYLTEITQLFKTVFNSTHLKDILTLEREIIRQFLKMDERWQYTCIKLITWKRKWYNVFKFCKLIRLEIDDHEIFDMYNYLKENKFVDTDYSNERLVELLNLLDTSDLKDICNRVRIKKNLKKKQDMIDGLIKYTTTQSVLPFQKSTYSIIMKAVEHSMGKCIKLNDTFYDVFYRIFVLGTFTNITFATIKDYFDNILNIKPVFPEYAREDHLIFYTRDEFVRYARAKKCREELEKVINVKDKNYLEILQVCEVIFNELQDISDAEKEMENRHKNAPHLIRFTAQSVYSSALTSATKALKAKFPERAKQWLEYMIGNVKLKYKLGDWCNDLSWLYMRYLTPVNYEYAAKLIIKVLQQNKEHLTEVQLYNLQYRGEQLKVGKKYKISQMHHDSITELVPKPIKDNNFPSMTVDAKAMRENVTGKKRNYTIQDAEGNKSYVSVEKRALLYYKEHYGYTDGIHCEGSLVMATFTLFFWDIIYNPKEVVPGTFISKIQFVPLDMFTKYFYLNRKAAIDKRLKEIESEWTDAETMTFVKEIWRLHSHKTALCKVDNYIEDPDFLDILVGCIGRNVLSKIYERLVKNVSQYRSGMPDLLLWKVDTKESKFVEVKGENDKLSIKQKLWLQYLASVRANIEVCIVHSLGSKRKKIGTEDGKSIVKASTSST